MQQIICKTGCIQSVGGAIDSTAAQYTITAHVKLYNAVQSARSVSYTHLDVYKRQRYITAAGSLLQDSMRVALSCTDTAKARAFAGTLSRRYISSSGEAPHEEIRLLSALTLQGIIFYSNTIAKLADTTVVLDDEYGAASRTLLYALREEALQKGHNIVTCYCSMSPYEKIERCV